MFQKFYTDTLGSRYIKSLLAHNPIPVFDSVVDGDYLVEGCYYVYSRFIIQCVSTGILKVQKTEILYPSNNLYPSSFLFPGTGYRIAKFYVKSYVDTEDIKTHNIYRSSTNYYDSDTHYYLGRYIRYIYTTTGLNLFPFYNMYNSTYFSDIELSSSNNKEVTVRRVHQSKNKVVAIPILFGHTYNIYLDSPTQVLIRACIHDNTGFIDEDKLPDYSYTSTDNSILSLKQTLADSGKILSHSRFDTPVPFRIEINSLSAMMLQHDLYLVIQLPITNDSSIVVLENTEISDGVICNKDSVREVSLLNPSLLQMNTHVSYAFSIRLIEYLIGHVTCDQDMISQNISKIQTILRKLYPDYSKTFLSGKNKLGVWNDDIIKLTYDLMETNKNDFNLYDQDGNINRDTEKLLYSIGGK